MFYYQIIEIDGQYLVTNGYEILWGHFGQLRSSAPGSYFTSLKQPNTHKHLKNMTYDQWKLREPQELRDYEDGPEEDYQSYEERRYEEKHGYFYGVQTEPLDPEEIPF